MGMIDRFFEAIEKAGITTYEIETKYGVKSAQSKISQMKGGKTNTGKEKSLPSDILSAVCMNCNKINSEYILTGRGNAINEDKNTDDVIPNIPTSSGTSITSEEEFQDAKNKGLHLLPQVSFKFAAGQTQLISITEDITRYWYLPDCKDCEGVAQIVGRSMSPTLPSGCWVALKRYTLPHDNPNTIPFGNIFGIVVEDKETGEYHGHIKILRRYKEQSLARKYWIAHSINTEEFDDFDIEIDQIRSLWIVKQHIVSDTLL